MLIEKLLTTDQKIINKKKSKRVGIRGTSWTVLDLYGLYSSHAYLTSGRQIGAPH
jgi:hypothetical protein